MSDDQKLSLSISNDALAITELLRDQQNERERLWSVLYRIRQVLGEGGRDVPLLDLPEYIASRLAPICRECGRPCPSGLHEHTSCVGFRAWIDSGGTLD